MPASRCSNSTDLLALNSCWREFDRLFPTEEACVEEIRRMIGADSKCAFCATPISDIPYGARSIKCQFCSKTHWLTAGTIFHRIRRARPWLAAIFLLEHGVMFNPFQFHKLLGIAYSSALAILKKLAMVIQNAMQDIGTVHVPSLLFLRIFAKRSRETPARKRPLAEQEAIDDASAHNDMDDENKPGSRSSSTGLPPALDQGKETVGRGNDRKETSENLLEYLALDPAEKAIYECLSLKPTPYDVICERVRMPIGEVAAALTIMELSGLVNRLPGDQYVRYSYVSTRGSPQTCLEGLTHKTLIDRIIAFTRDKFQGISRKYLQNYISLHWCQVDRKRWDVGSLLELCLSSGPVTHREILGYVTPPMVQIAVVTN
jgi:hypothetical protein